MATPSPEDETGPGASGRGEGRAAQNDAWGAFGLLVSGVVVWGGAGMLVAHWTGQPLFTLLGLLLGTGAALYGIWFRYGRA